MFRSHSSVRPVALVAVLAVSALAACTPEPSPRSTPRTASSSPAPTPTAASPTPTPSPTGTPTPVALTCDQVITLQQLYDFNPNFGVNPGYSPATGSPGATAVAAKGVACSWMNQTSRETIDVSIAKPAPEQLAALKADAAAGTSTDAYEAEGYFAAAGGAGTAQIFTDGYWVTATSSWFQQPGDASAIVSDVLGNLP